MKRSIAKLLSISLICVSASGMVCNAGIESGKVYRFKNVGKSAINLAASPAVQGAVGANANENDLKQQWYLEADAANSGFYFRNANSGAYLTSPLEIYTQWPLTFTTSPDANKMLLTITDYEGNLVIKAKSHNNNYAYAHCDGSNNIVCWLSSSTPTQWTYEEVPYNATQIAEMKARWQATGDEIGRASLYQTYLDNLFRDKACTELSYSGELSESSDYNNLPQTLKTMVEKVKRGDWSETDGNWDSEHANKYRVQLYEPYSEGSAAAGMAGIQAYTNMNNPTGIIANEGEMLYVMVNSDIPEGATLYIGAVPDCSMYNSVTSGTQLKKGLNMIICNSDVTHYFIYYTVNTVSNRKPVRGRELSNYQPIKIHIEGGRVNGFFNYVGDTLYKPDSKEDFEYTTQRAKHPMFDLIGKYVILHFYLEDTPDVPGNTPQICVKNAFTSKNPNKRHDDPVLTMQAWDNMCFAERILMGLQSDEDINNEFNQGLYETIVGKQFNKNGYDATLDFHYNDYFNNRMMGINYQAAGLYMNATSWRTAYAPSTVATILSEFPEAGIWGPAHEYGHMNQGPIAIAGTTEESNNVFSNVANYFICKTTSRTDYPSQQLKNFNAGNTFLDNETWGTTRMFWQLWCYYHYCGHNKQFYPRLYELLRRYPLVRETTTYNGKLNAKKDLLHFAKMACLAAGEDLTNFFASWGFFSPQESYHIDDYSIYDMYVSQEDINEIKNEIKSWKLPKNDAIILIDDRVNSSLTTGFGYNKEACGTYGGVDSFKDGAANNGDFEFTVDGNTVTVKGGKPGAGYLIYDKDGNLIGFSNSDSFTLSNDAAQALVDGTATVKAVDTQNNTTPVSDPVRDGSIQRKNELLKTLIDSADALLSRADESLTHVGMIFPENCVELKTAREQAYALWESSSTSSDDLTNEYLSLSAKYYELLNNASARIPVEPNNAYRLINHNYTNRALDADGEYCVSTTFNTNSSMVPFGQQWVLEPVTEGDLSAFYIKNLASGKYIGTTKKQSTNIPVSNTPQSYTFITIEPGVYSFAPDNETRYGIHIDAGNKVVQWNTTSTPTQWSLVKTSTIEQIALREELSNLIDEAQQKLSACGMMERKEPETFTFPDDCLYTNAKYTGNNTDAFKSWNVLFDDNINTYFHSNYDNNKDSDDGLDHYIRMKAPDNSSFRFFNLEYTTRNIANTGTNPRSIVIEASKDGESWKEIFHASGLPTGQAINYSTGGLTAPDDTQYIRLMVTGSGGTAKGHPYFVLSELRVYDLGEPVFTPDEDFPYLTAEAMASLYDAIIDATLDLADSSTSAQNLKDRTQTLKACIESVSSVMIPKVDVNEITIPVDRVVLKMNTDPAVINATIDPVDATFPEFVWNIEDDTVAKISAVDGKTVELTPIAMGETTLSVNVVGNPLVSASVPVKVLPEIPVEALAVVPAELTLPVNAGEFTLSYETYPENASVKEVVWSSSDMTVASIDSMTGLLNLERPGTCEIYATTTDGTDISAKCTLTVTNAVAEGLILYPENLILQQGEEFTMGVTYLPADAEQPLVSWDSSASDIVSVDPSGNVLALNVGEASITVKATVNGHELSAMAYVTVIPVAVKGISLSEVALTIPKGSSATVNAVFTPANSFANLDWSVTDPEVVSLEENDKGDAVTLTALKPGMVTLIANLRDNDLISATCNITVPEIAVERIIFTDDENEVDGTNGVKTIEVKTLPEEAPVPRLNWEIDDEGIAVLNPTKPLECEFHPKNNGTVKVKVSHADRPEIFAERTLNVSGISGIMNLFEDKVSPVDIYEPTGVLVRKQVLLKDLNNLKPGIYILRQNNTSIEVYIR